MTKGLNTELNQEDQLKEILYQFILLYERWADDRQLAAQQGADMAELIKLFTNQISDFKTLESKVRQEIAHTIQQSTTVATQEITTKVSKIATDQVDGSTKRLQKAVEAAAQQLNAHQRQVYGWYYWWIGSIFALAFAVGLCAVRFVMSDPYLPLTGQQLQTYENGRLFEAFWLKLSKKEKDHLIALAKSKDSTQLLSDDSSVSNSYNN